MDSGFLARTAESAANCPELFERGKLAPLSGHANTDEHPMKTLSSEEAAALLHLNVKQVQTLARAGKLPAVRVGRKWLFPQDRIERLLGRRRVAAPMEISARNRLRGTIAHLRFDGLMAEVAMRIGEQELVSVITRSSAERMKLRVGDEVFAVVKSTEVMIGKEEGEE
jgi:molybdopterin-binding protein